MVQAPIPVNSPEHPSSPPEVLAGLNFDGRTKREVADDLVSRLPEGEAH